MVIEDDDGSIQTQEATGSAMGAKARLAVCLGLKPHELDMVNTSTLADCFTACDDNPHHESCNKPHQDSCYRLCEMAQ